MLLLIKYQYICDVEHFYLIDNGSDDDPLSILQEYIDKGIVTYYFLPEKHKQTEYYRYVFDNANLKNETFWLTVCDLDIKIILIYFI